MDTPRPAKTKAVRTRYLEPIYPNQAAFADAFIKAIWSGSKSILSLADFQSGKTGATMESAIQYDYHFPVHPQIIFLNHLSDNHLKNQTGERLENAGFDVLTEPLTPPQIVERRLVSNKPPAFIFQHNDIRRLELMDWSHRTLLVLDECQVALGKDRVLDTFLRRIGVVYGEHPSTWENQSVDILSVSATPFAQLAKEQQIILAGLAQGAFTVIKMENDPHYTGLVQLRQKNRLVAAAEMFTNGRLSKSFQHFIEGFLFKCAGPKGNGYAVVRAGTKTKQAKLAKLLVGRGLNFQYMTCDTGLPELDDVLGKKPAKPTVLLFANALSAGKTINTSNIRGWWEGSSKGTNADTAGQRIGRNCGHNKQDDDYSIYCDMNHVLAVMAFQKKWDDNAIPSSRFTAAAVRRAGVYRIVETKPAGMTDRSGNRVSDHTDDVADQLLRNITRSDARSRFINIDGPSTKCETGAASWAKLMALHPDWKDKYAVWDETGIHTEPAKLRSRCMIENVPGLN